jgi:fatty acid amide hydrolase
MDQIANLSCCNILQLIDDGELSCRQVAEYYIGRIEEVNPNLNAVVVKMFEEALKQADKQ